MQESLLWNEFWAIWGISLESLQSRMQYSFTCQSYLQGAVTHKSALRSYRKLNPEFKCPSQLLAERLEFLGDSVLGFIASSLLWEKYPKASEGELSRLRATLVQKQTLAKLAQTLQLEDVIRLGAPEAKQGLNRSEALLADSFEAIIGALYLDAGLEVARKFVSNLLHTYLQTASVSDLQRDHKTRLQELVQKHVQKTPSYIDKSTEGPEHKPVFRVSVEISGKEYGSGVGPTKKDAQQHAAELSYYKFQAQLAAQDQER